MMRKKQKNKPARKTDPRLAGAAPTAQSPEFVPVTMDALPPLPRDGSDETYDFIPELKDPDKYR